MQTRFKLAYRIENGGGPRCGAATRNNLSGTNPMEENTGINRAVVRWHKKVDVHAPGINGCSSSVASAVQLQPDTSVMAKICAAMGPSSGFDNSYACGLQCTPAENAPNINPTAAINPMKAANRQMGFNSKRITSFPKVQRQYPERSSHPIYSVITGSATIFPKRSLSNITTCLSSSWFHVSLHIKNRYFSIVP